MKTAFRFVEKRNLWISISSLVLVLAVIVGINRVIHHEPALNFGIDFTGGTSIILKANNLAQTSHSGDTVSAIRKVLADAGFTKSQIQITNDKEVVIRTSQVAIEKRVELLRELDTLLGKTEVLEVDDIGPTIGGELRYKSIWIVVLVLIALQAFITWRFEFSFGIAALLALLHDAVIPIGLAVIFNFEIDTSFVAAILMVLGYSMNDTIVVFDRIRETIQKSDGTLPYATVINMSITQTLTRTTYTSLTALMMLASLIIFGGITTRAFCWILFIGILSGTYSSIFIASPILPLISGQPKQKS